MGPWRSVREVVAIGRVRALQYQNDRLFFLVPKPSYVAVAGLSPMSACTKITYTFRSEAILFSSPINPVATHSPMALHNGEIVNVDFAPILLELV